MKNLGRKFWFALVLFALIGQVAWVVENMYLNVFMYKMFHATAAQISMMVSASAVAAAVTTILMGALSDRLGKRKLFICGGYIIWGVTILAFGLVRMDILTPLCGSAMEAAALGINLTILLDCLMTFFGSTANDAAFNAWLTDAGDDSNRGKIEGINAMMPLVAIIVVFGGFMGFSLDLSGSWTLIYAIIGGVVLLIGVLGIFLIQEVSVKNTDGARISYWENLRYSFRPGTIAKNKLLYAIIVAFAIFGISIQIFMPYLIVYYEQTLQMSNYVLVLAPAIILASAATAIYGTLYDQLGFQKSVIPCVIMLLAGYGILYFARATVPVFIGSLLMMCGYLCGMAVFGAVIRERIPAQMAGRFQGIRIIGQVLIPGVIGPSVGAWVLRDAVQIENQDGTFSFLPNENIWLAAAAAAIVLLAALYLIFLMIRKGHYELWTESGERTRNRRKKAWREYPRPQMRRDGYLILDEGWKLNGQEINMPYPPESMLADYNHKVGSRLHYETTFTVPKNFKKGRILLHFGAVDQTAEVRVNGQTVGSHAGGYLPFTFDITEAVKRDEVNTLQVKAKDTLSKVYPYGKQCKKRGGMWYTPVSGIWQSVWLENVPRSYMKHLRITPDLNGIDLDIHVLGAPSPVQIRIPLDNGEVWEQTWDVRNGRIDLSKHMCKNGEAYVPRTWTTEDPYLYTMEITMGEDKIETYFALRTIAMENHGGVKRVCLNGKPIFLHGLLDQGYYSDGIYLPAEPKEFERDILRMKELGFNTLRKHIKIEPEAFYYYCDKHGMLVMQDMVNNGGYSFIRDTALPTIGMKKKSDKTGMKGKRKEFYIRHTEQTVKHLYNHPCIVAYTVFNEAWGQFESDKMYELVKKWDGTRLIDSTSGWFWQEKSDFDSEHIYFKRIDLDVKKRPLFVSECGGYSRVVDGHYYSKYSTYGYGGAESEEELTERIADMYRRMIQPGIVKGVCGCIYTQVSDVEDEVNGLYTYDRKVCKVNKAVMRQVAGELYESL